MLFRATALGPVRILIRFLTLSTSLSNSVIGGTSVRISRYGNATAWERPDSTRAPTNPHGASCVLGAGRGAAGACGFRRGRLAGRLYGGTVVGGPGFDPGASRSRTVSPACPRLSRLEPGMRDPAVIRLRSMSNQTKCSPPGSAGRESTPPVGLIVLEERLPAQSHYASGPSVAARRWCCADQTAGP